jgi:hypothetical protein
VKVLKEITNASRAALSWEKYATGIKSGFPYCANSSIPSTCVFDHTARQTIDWMGQELGTNHIGFWVNEATSQAEWDAWGYFLQGKSPPPPPPSPRPPPAPPPPPLPPPGPPRPCKITIHHTIGCYNDSEWSGASRGLVLPAWQKAQHGKISLQGCADACHAAKSTVAGVRAGADCFCGGDKDIETASAKARSRPKPECMKSVCDADPGEKECGGPGRLLAFRFSCD